LEQQVCQDDVQGELEMSHFAERSALLEEFELPGFNEDFNERCQVKWETGLGSEHQFDRMNELVDANSSSKARIRLRAFSFGSAPKALP
jgi:hypothetical protein